MSPHNDAPSLPGSFDDQFSSMILSDHPSMTLPDTLKPPYLQYADSMSDATLTDSDEETAIHPTRPLVPGLYVPTVAFFNKTTEELDLATIARHAVRLAEAGVAGLTTQGSNGEAVHLSHRERKIVTSTTRKALDNAGFRDMPVIVGCGAQSTRETIELCREALLSGGDYALVLPPSYYRPLFKSESIIEFFNDVADESPIPILIYNYPGAVSGIDLDSDAIIRLSKHRNIVGCKLTCGNTGKLNRIAAATMASTPTDVGSGFMCLGGSCDFTLQTLLGGGSGTIGGLANIAPKACVKIINLYTAGNFKEAKKMQAVVARGDWAAIQGGIIGTKSALESYFGYGGYARKPLPRPTPEEVAKYAQDFKELVALEKTL
jgi:4-hydroxy-2-oxoglutarate aldolase